MVYETLVYLVGLVAAIWVVLDVLINQKKMESLHKVLWIVGAVFFNIITAVVYYFVVKRKN